MTGVVVSALIALALCVMALTGVGWSWWRQRGTAAGVAICVASTELALTGVMLAVFAAAGAA